MAMISKDKVLEAARATGVDLTQDGEAMFWQGPYGGQTKPKGPLAGKKIACLAGSEFSDFQAYYLASYIGEFGGELEFLLVDWVTYKFTRPNIQSKGVVGMWGLTLDPIPVMGPTKHSSKNLKEARAADYDAAVVIGGHSADVIVTEKEVADLLTAVAGSGRLSSAASASGRPAPHPGRPGQGQEGHRQQALADFMLKKHRRLHRDAPVVDRRPAHHRPGHPGHPGVRSGSLPGLYPRTLSDDRQGCLAGQARPDHRRRGFRGHRAGRPLPGVHLPRALR